MLLFPEIVYDVLEIERNTQIDGFAQHRHDQSVLSILVLTLRDKYNIFLLPEEFETENKYQIVKTSRKVDVSSYFKLKNLLKKLLISAYQRL